MKIYHNPRCRKSREGIKYLESRKINFEIIEYLKKNPSSLESIRAPLLEQKIIDSIISNANVKNKIINEEDYKKLEQETFNIKKDK